MPVQISEMNTNVTSTAAPGATSSTSSAISMYEQRIRNLEDKIASIFRPDGSVMLQSPNKVEIVVGGSRITVDRMGVHISSAAAVDLNGAKINLVAPHVQIDSAMCTASGVVRCDTIIATSVIGASYTPGAGNVW